MTGQRGQVLRRQILAFAKTVSTCAVWCALFGLLVTAGDAPATERPALPGILGRDDRMPMDTQDWPWAAIGRVNRSGGGFCTGTLVGRQVVLTAAHCLYDRRTGRRVRPDEIHFLAGYRRGSYIAHAPTRELIIADEYRFEDARRAENLAADWALLVLADPMRIRPLPIQADPPSADAALVRAGYGQDRPHLLSIHDGCGPSVASTRPGLLLHTCDATRGDSGSPLLLRGADGPAIVGLDVAAGRVGGAMVGLAVPSVTFLDRVRAVLAIKN